MIPLQLTQFELSAGLGESLEPMQSGQLASSHED